MKVRCWRGEEGRGGWSRYGKGRKGEMRVEVEEEEED